MRIYYDTEAKSALQFKSELSRLRNAELAPPLATPTPIGEKVLPHLAIQGMSVEGTKSMKAPSPSLYRWDDWGPKRFSVWPTLKQATWTQVFRSQVQSSAHCSTTFSFLESGICHWPQAAWCGSCPLKGSMHQGWEPKAPNSRATVSLQTRKGSWHLHPPLSSPQATASFPSRHTWQLTLHLSPQLHSCFVPRHFPKGPSRGSL